MSSKYPKSDLPETIAKPHRAALRTDAQRRAKPKVEKPGQGLKQSDILAFNHDAENAFVRLLKDLLQEDGKLSYREAVREAAFELNVSIETAKRYLEKHSARRAEFCIEDGSVTLRRQA
jgi:hypothetical protein